MLVSNSTVPSWSIDLTTAKCCARKRATNRHQVHQHALRSRVKQILKGIVALTISTAPVACADDFDTIKRIWHKQLIAKFGFPIAAAEEQISEFLRTVASVGECAHCGATGRAAISAGWFQKLSRTPQIPDPSSAPHQLIACAECVLWDVGKARCVPARCLLVAPQLCASVFHWETTDTSTTCVLLCACEIE